MKPINISSLPEGCIDEYAKGVTTKFLGRACGSNKLYVNIDTLPPGTYSAKYHAHTLQEEFFIILSGSGVLRMNGEETPVAKGDMVSKACGGKVSHQFFNSGGTPMEILDIGTVEAGDVCFYPDDGIMLLRDERLAFRKCDALEGWSSDPNQSA